MKFFFPSILALSLVAAGIGCGQDKKVSGPAPAAPAAPASTVQQPPPNNEDVTTPTLSANLQKSPTLENIESLDPSEALAQRYGALAFALDKEDLALKKAIRDKNNTVQLGPEFGKALVLALGTTGFGLDGARRLGYVGQDWTKRFTRTKVTEGEGVAEGAAELSTTEKVIEVASRPSKIVGGGELLVATVLGVLAAGETYKWGKDSYFVVFGSNAQIREQEKKVAVAKMNFERAAKDMHALAYKEVNPPPSPQQQQAQQEQQQQQQQQQAPN